MLYQLDEEIGTVADTTASNKTVFGREHELRSLKTAAENLQAGDGGTVSIIGAAGLGKSLMVKNFREYVDSVDCLQMRGEPYGMSSPYSLLRQPMRKLLRIDSSQPQQAEQQLQAAVAEADQELLPLLALVGDLVQIEIEPSAEVAAIEASFRPDRTAETAIRLLGALHAGPLAVIVEDAQWADELSVRVLNQIALACEENPWLVVAARRDEDQGFMPDAAVTLALEPLEPKHIKSLVIAMTASAPLRPHEVDLVVERAGGNPLFAEEIIRAAREAGSVEALPDSVEAAMAARVDALDPTARRALRYATVLGRRFSQDILSKLLESEGHQLDLSILQRLSEFIELAALVDDGDLDDVGAEWDKGDIVFRNNLIRRTIYEGLAHRLRRRLHRVAGETIEDMAANTIDVAADLARHYSIAANHERTWHYARIAGERAGNAWANPEAARLYEMAADAAQKLADIDDQAKADNLTDLGQVRDRAGMVDEALDAYRKAAKFLSGNPVAQAKLMFHRAYVRERAGSFSAARRELTTGQRLLEKADSPEARKTLARLASFTAMILFAQEHYRDAVKQSESAIELARSAGNRPALAEALVAADLAKQYLEPGDSDNMLEALAIYKDLGDLSSEAMVNCNLGVAAYITGKWDEALDWYQGYRDLSLRVGDAVGAATADSNIGEILVKRGQLDDAEVTLKEAVRVMESAGFQDGAAWAEIQIGRILVERGALREADELMTRVGNDFKQFGQSTSALEAALVQALAMIQTQRAAEALKLLDEAKSAAGADAQVYEPIVADVLAKAHLALNDLAAAEKSVAAGLLLARELRLPYEESMLLLTRIDIARHADRAPDSSDLKNVEKILGGLGINYAEAT